MHGAKVWRIPLSASAEVRQLAEKYGAQIEELAIEGGYSADAAHRIAELEAQLVAVPRIGDDSPPPPRDDSELIRLRAEVAALKEDVARLTAVLRQEKDRAGRRATGKAPVVRRKAATVTGGRTKAKATGKIHGQCIEHWRIEGMQKAICVLGPRRVDGVQLPAQTTDEVVGFAEEIVQLVATQGDVLDRLRYERAAAKA